MRGGVNIAIIFWVGFFSFALLSVKSALLVLGSISAVLLTAFLIRVLIDVFRSNFD